MVNLTILYLPGVVYSFYLSLISSPPFFFFDIPLSLLYFIFWSTLSFIPPDQMGKLNFEIILFFPHSLPIISLFCPHPVRP